EPGFDAPIELGAEFIHGHAQPTVEWLHKAGKGVVQNPDTHWRLQNGELQKQDHLFDEILQVFRRHQAAATDEISLDTFLKTQVGQGLSTQAREYVRLMAEGFDAADITRVSAKMIVEEWTGEMLEAKQSRPEGGYTSLLTALAAALPEDKVRV